MDKKTAMRHGVDFLELVASVKPGKPLVDDAPVCDSMREDEFTQLTFYVCKTKGCPFKDIPYQIRERRGV